MKIKHLILAMTALFSFFGCTAANNGTAVNNGNKVLVAYFSATGNTKAAAEKIAKATRDNLYDITPAEAYTSADLNWNDPDSRSSKEMNDPAIRPALAGNMTDMRNCDVVFLGYPIWWGIAPRIINSFIESGDFNGKRIFLFATSGGSGIDQSIDELRKTYPALDFAGGKLLNRASQSSVDSWVSGILND